ncbi:MAG TPA: hypothetical protein EYG86_06750 [Crocinitomicaceae bacterium]|nr:hypothetical protein [Crocinitomicaceae bacterium]
MKFITLLIISVFTLGTVNAQDCERIVQDCEALLTDENGNKFVSDGQVYTAFLDREKAEFKTTFFGGSTYRLATSAGSRENFVIFTIKDQEGHILFSNKNYKNSPYWDFKVDNTIPVTITTELDLDLKVTGCVVMLIGFKN